MSRVMLVAADRSLPACDRQTERTHISRVDGKDYAVACMAGFQLIEHSYYRWAVDELGYPMKPFRYELSMEHCETDLRYLVAYLREQVPSGEEVELWSVWVGGERETLRRFRGTLEEFDLDALGKLFEREQTCLTVSI